MKLSEILKNINIVHTNFKIDENKDVKEIAFHTKDVVEGAIFVAIKGYVTDGHKYIKKAKELGAEFALVEDFVDVDIKQIKVKNSRIALADMATNFYKNPSKDMNVIGITATNGKTTTAFMVDSILKEDKRETGMIGTVLTRYKDVKIPSILTTPESLTLQSYFRDMLDKNITDVTMEVSSSAQELFRDKNIDFDIVTFNNLGREHIDQHGSFEKYFHYKSRLIRHVKKDALAILNADDEMIYSLKEKTHAKVLSFSLENNGADFGISDLDLSTGKGKFIFNINKDIKLKDFIIKKSYFKVELGSVGYSSVMNSVVAIIVALCLNIKKDIITNALKNFKGVERRFELIFDEDFKILDDHFANEKNIDATMETLRMMDYKDLNILYAIRGHRGVEVNREITERLVKWIKVLKPKSLSATLSKEIVKEKDKVTEDELNIFKKILNENNIKCKIYDTLEEAINSSIDLLNNGDVLLLAGCQGMDKGAKFVKEKLLRENKVKDICGFSQRIDSRIC